MKGLVVLEFGASWCPHCKALQPVLQTALARFPQVQHLVIEDGRGQPLGRSFGVKLWPTLVLLRDGEVVELLVRPTAEEVGSGLTNLVDGDLQQ